MITQYMCIINLIVRLREWYAGLPLCVEVTIWQVDSFVQCQETFVLCVCEDRYNNTHDFFLCS